MANIEQKRADLEKALRAIDEDEMKAVAGGLSEKAKLALQIGGAVAATLLVTGGASVAAYFGAKSGAKPKDFRGRAKVAPVDDDLDQDPAST